MYFISYFFFLFSAIIRTPLNTHTLDRYLKQNQVGIVNWILRLNWTIRYAHYEREKMLPCFHISHFTPTSAYKLNRHTHMYSVQGYLYLKDVVTPTDKDFVLKVNLIWYLVRKVLFDMATREFSTFILLTHTKLAFCSRSV